jgi:hypothetical protein
MNARDDRREQTTSRRSRSRESYAELHVEDVRAAAQGCPARGAELARQPERRGFIDGADMLTVFSRLYTRAQEEHRDATAQGQKGRAHQLENELDALARAMNWAMRVP